MPISKVGFKGNNGKNWLLDPGTSSQSEGYSSKWLIWLVCREPLDMCIYSTLQSSWSIIVCAPSDLLFT